MYSVQLNYVPNIETTLMTAYRLGRNATSNIWRSANRNYTVLKYDRTQKFT